MDIILIGMPGCGKTTIGKILAKKLKLEFVDADDELVRIEGREPNEIFATDGEGYFRKAETECLKKILGKNRVISTGGGVVVTEENHRIIKESDSVTVFIDRPPELIMGDVKTSTRPLLADGKERIMKLYSERYDKYVSLCDIRIENVGTIDDIVSGILYEVKIYENNGN